MCCWSGFPGLEGANPGNVTTPIASGRVGAHTFGAYRRVEARRPSCFFAPLRRDLPPGRRRPGDLDTIRLGRCFVDHRLPSFRRSAQLKSVLQIAVFRMFENLELFIPIRSSEPRDQGRIGSGGEQVPNHDFCEQLVLIEPTLRG